MRVFCSQCGTPNEGKPGTKVICTNCTAVFDVPAVDPGLAQTVMSPPSGSQSQQPQQPTPQQPLAPPQQQPAPSWGTPSVNPGQTGPAYPAPAPAQQTETLAIISLVLGILCCIPFGSIAAIICGALAIQKINANPSLGGKGLAIAGISLGGLSVAFSVIMIVISLVTNH